MIYKGCIVCKPDAVERGIVELILEEIRREGLGIVGSVRLRLSRNEAMQIGPNPRRAPTEVYESFLSYMTRGDSVVVIVEGDDVCNRSKEVRKKVRTAHGLPARWDGGTFENLIHVPDQEDMDRALETLHRYILS